MSKIELNIKKQLLKNAADQLKKEFIGLDGIVDEVTDIMLPWYLFPEHQMRPLIINLWGMTGSGKTALIKRLAELIHYQNLTLRFDMGEYGNNSSFLKYTFTGQLEQFNDSSPIIVLDEFQFAKTKDENGKEVNNTSLRVIWDLLDSGELIYEPSVNTYYFLRGKKILQLLRTLQKQGTVVEKGIIKTNIGPAHEQLSSIAFGYGSEESNVNEAEGQKKKFGAPAEYLLSDTFCTGYFEIVARDFNVWQDIREMLQSTKSIDEIIALMATDLEEAIALRKMNLSRSLIFVVGNLDEAYSMSHNINPDIDADEFRRHTLKINIADIKTALQSRFRNEQIARLGNNHLIYYAFSHADFQALIKMHLRNITKQIKERFKIKVTFSRTVEDMLYAEGVFPTQGVRPVISTIRNHIEANIAKVMLHIHEQTKPIKSMHWEFEPDNFIISFDVGKPISLKVNQKINNLRKSAKSDLQAMVAVHESGHTLVSMFAAKIVPEYVITRTVDSESNGFAYSILPEDIPTKRLLLDKIRIYLGGYMAEQMIFGTQNNTSGVYDDFNKATQIANQLIRDYGMNGKPYKLNLHQYGGNPYQFTFTPEDERDGIAIMHACLEDVRSILEQHMPFFVELSIFLSDNSRIDKEDIIKMYKGYCKKHNVKSINFVDKDSYYNFRKQLHKLK